LIEKKNCPPPHNKTTPPFSLHPLTNGSSDPSPRIMTSSLTGKGGKVSSHPKRSATVPSLSPPLLTFVRALLHVVRAPVLDGGQRHLAAGLGGRHLVCVRACVRGGGQGGVAAVARALSLADETDRVRPLCVPTARKTGGGGLRGGESRRTKKWGMATDRADAGGRARSGVAAAGRYGATTRAGTRAREAGGDGVEEKGGHSGCDPQNAMID